MKYLKSEEGFVNYDLLGNPESRYHKKRLKFDASEILPLPAFRSRFRCDRGILGGIASRLNSKFRLKAERDLAVATSFPQATLEDAIIEESPEFAELIFNHHLGC